MGNYINKLIRKNENDDLALNKRKKRKFEESDQNDSESSYFSEFFDVKRQKLSLLNEDIFGTIGFEGISFEPIDKTSTLMKPNKKIMKSTSSYIYKTLFINGENSDLKVLGNNLKNFL
jgi:hypothetical protein